MIKICTAERPELSGIGRYEGFAGVTATILELPVSLLTRLNFEKPRCPQIPLDTIVIIFFSFVFQGLGLYLSHSEHDTRH